jgi:hypothetical protein
MRAEKDSESSETPIWQNDGAWKFLAGVLLGYCIKAFGSGFKPRVGTPLQLYGCRVMLSDVYMLMV